MNQSINIFRKNSVNYWINADEQNRIISSFSQDYRLWARGTVESRCFQLDRFEYFYIQKVLRACAFRCFVRHALPCPVRNDWSVSLVDKYGLG